jgi:hypothetical protein
MYLCTCLFQRLVAAARPPPGRRPVCNGGSCVCTRALTEATVLPSVCKLQARQQVYGLSGWR